MEMPKWFNAGLDVAFSEVWDRCVEEGVGFKLWAHMGQVQICIPFVAYADNIGVCASNGQEAATIAARMWPSAAADPQVSLPVAIGLVRREVLLHGRPRAD